MDVTPQIDATVGAHVPVFAMSQWIWLIACLGLSRSGLPAASVWTNTSREVAKISIASPA